MKLSNYLIIKQIKDEYVLFSTISKNIIKVTNEFFKELQNINENDFKIIKSEELKYLKEKYFVIEDGVDESRLIEFILDEDRLNQKIFSSYIAFSTLCNFGCVYCYEEGQTKRDFIMNEKILNHTIEWYKKTMINNNYKTCKITLFGGEPLLHKDLIKIFVKEIKNFTLENNIQFRLAIITNGYLLDQDIVDFFNKHNLEEIQITLDGVGKEHDKRRPLRDGGPTFERIINNIKNIKKFDGKFLFRVSFDKSNKEEVKKLLQYLKKLNIENKFEIYLAPIHQTTSQCEKSCSFCSKNTTENLDSLISLYKELYTFMKEIGFSIPKFITNGPCMTVSKDTILADPYGKLFKCVEMIGIDELIVGNVDNYKYNQKLSNFIGHPNYKSCIEKKCKYVGLCGGGCLMKSYLKNQTLSELDCQYKLFENLIPFLLELNYGI